VEWCVKECSEVQWRVVECGKVERHAVGYEGMWSGVERHRGVWRCLEVWVGCRRVEGDVKESEGMKGGVAKCDAMQLNVVK
jgi:hypothetical protein